MRSKSLNNLFVIIRDAHFHVEYVQPRLYINCRSSSRFDEERLVALINNPGQKGPENEFV